MLSFSNGTPKELFLEVRILEEFGALGLQSGKMKSPENCTRNHSYE
jgi:hypothetical protein